MESISFAVSSSPSVWHMEMSPAAMIVGSEGGAVWAWAPGRPRVRSGGTSRAAGSQRHLPRFEENTSSTSATLLTLEDFCSAEGGAAPRRPRPPVSGSVFAVDQLVTRTEDAAVEVIAAVDPVQVAVVTADHDVIAPSADELVITPSAGHGVVAVVADHGVIAAVAVDVVVAEVAADGVVSGAAGNRVVPASPADEVITATAVDDVVAFAADDGVIVTGTVQDGRAVLPRCVQPGAAGRLTVAQAAD